MDRCPECEKARLKSTVRITKSSSTLGAFRVRRDADGLLRTHDPNTYHTEYECSNGHTFTSAGTRYVLRCRLGGEKA